MAGLFSKEQVKEREDSKAFKLGKQILKEQDLKFTVNYNGEVFTLQHPTPLLKSQIEAEISRRLDGLPRESFSRDHLIMIEATTYVNNLVIPTESPSWFTSAWTCYDDVLISELYSGYLSFRDSFRKKLQAGGFTAGN